MVNRGDLQGLSCPACKSNEASYVEGHDNYKIYKCQRCSIEFCDPMKAMSSEEYEKSVEYGEFRQLGTADHQSTLWWGHRQFFDDVPELPTPDRPLRLLDIGCGTGSFLKLAQEKGYDAYGIDFDRASIQVALTSGKLEGRVFVADEREALKRFGPSSFDAITFFEFLEHVEDPIAFVGHVRELLAPNAVMGLVVPQADRLSLRYQEREPADYPPNHLTRWTGKALKRFVGATGFEIIKFRESPISFGLYRVIAKRSRKQPASAQSEKSPRPSPASSGSVRSFFEFAFRCKQTLLGPVFSVMGLRGDRILLIAKKQSH